LKYLNKVIRY